MPINLIFFL
jgi:hypothetical protein